MGAFKIGPDATQLRAMLRADQASAALGMVLEVDEPGYAVVSMTVREDMTNGFAITHGGLVLRSPTRRSRWRAMKMSG